MQVKKPAAAEKNAARQASLADFGANDLVQRIRTVNLDEMTPMQALNLLYEWKAVAEKLP